MITFSQIALGIVFGIITLMVALELGCYLSLGGIYSEEELDSFFNKNLTKYSEQNSFSKSPLISVKDYKSELPYISSNFSILSYWYIQNGKRISRWSKWSKELDKKYEEIMKKKGGRYMNPKDIRNFI